MITSVMSWKKTGSLNMYIFLAIVLTLFSSFASAAEAPGKAHFFIIPLGTSGGELENNLSSYVVAPIHSDDFVVLDAGTLCSSIKNLTSPQLQQLGVKNLAGESLQETFFKHSIKAYLISHPHLDHISGLVMCSTIDTEKPILGTDTTIDSLRDNVFNWKIWPNFADEGTLPLLKTYHYDRLKFDSNYLIPKTNLKVRAFLLSHGNGYPSTAFLLEYQQSYLLYVGDTGADVLEKSSDLNKLWREIAPLIRAHQLSTIFIEASYPNSRPDDQLFGHLNPRWLLTELNALAILVNPQQPQQALRGLNIIVTHIKQGLESKNNAELIDKELNSANTLGVHFIIPHPGQMLSL